MMGTAKVLGLAAGLCVATASQAAVYDFDAEPTNNLDTSLWAVTENAPSPAHFGYVIANSAITFQKGPNNLTFTAGQSIFVSLNMAAVGGPLSGDFNVSVNYTGAFLEGNTFFIKLLTGTSSATYTGGEATNPQNHASYSYLSAAVPPNTSFDVPVPDTLVDSGQLTILRNGSLIQFWHDGVMQFGMSGFTGDITGISLGLTSDSNNDYGQVTFSNFAINGVPEPASLTMMAAAGTGLLLRRRK